MATIAGGIILFGAIVVALNAIVLKLFKPMFRGVVALSEFTESVPTLIDIAKEFHPNDGHTLRDQVDGINIKLNNIEGQLETLITNSHSPTLHGTGVHKTEVSTPISPISSVPVTFDLPTTGSM